jgi:hypothetical protein
MPTVTLELTENEARIIVATLNIAANNLGDGLPFILEDTDPEFNIPREHFEAFRPKLQACKDEFNRRLSRNPEMGDVRLETIPWPPTDLDIIEFLVDTLCSQLPEFLFEADQVLTDG